MQKCTCAGASLRGSNFVPLCCIKLDTATDPACGSGNFLTETYISLRRLENEALKYILDGQMMFDIDPIKVNISQFYGIEINDFAVTVAKTALWIAEAQMLQETEEIVEHNIPFLPLKSYANITEGNALRIDWESVVSKDKLSYIMGNPPFVGYTYQSIDQKADLNNAVGGTAKNIDYVMLRSLMFSLPDCCELHVVHIN